jgi:Ni,Fe-hydrogenase III small subunit/formate hydrogenlyase subunit 6/NADH:ubiquinone oxidoreductase subunit I
MPGTTCEAAVIRILRTRLAQGCQTSGYPGSPVTLPQRYRGRPTLDPAKCLNGCRACAAACPTAAIRADPLELDLGACLFCPVCAEVCPAGAIAFTGDHRLAARRRADLVVREGEAVLAAALEQRMRKLLGRSLKLRHVAAGDCGGCAAELAALSNVVFDLGRFGIQFVASPRHADGLVITGPVTPNMVEALRATYAAMPAPKIVIAVGACAISGGPFAGGEPALAGVPDDLPVDLFVPGCPPHPYTLLDGLLRLLGQRAEP